MSDVASISGEWRALSSLRLGEGGKVRVIDGGRFMTQRMGMLGIRPGVEVRVVHGPGKRGAVLQVGGARIALGRGVIERIRVEKSPCADVSACVQGGRP